MTTEEEARRDARRNQHGDIYTPAGRALELCPQCRRLGVILDGASICVTCSDPTPARELLWNN